ncbi:hypothetical protein FQA39_LY09554 [Lamprigera yunnana]|nr:hypothetical protein FQA39_LY09554 [Lamprigera yunnana]
MATKEKDDERKFILECIEVYHSLPALWNIKSKDYSNRIKKNKQYTNLLRKYREYYPDADKAQLVKKFNSLRTNFRKELERIKDSEKSGAGTDDIIEPTLWYFEEMNVLVGQEEPSTSQSTIQIQDDNTQGGEDDIDDVEIREPINISTINVVVNADDITCIGMLENGVTSIYWGFLKKISFIGYWIRNVGIKEE